MLPSGNREWDSLKRRQTMNVGKALFYSDAGFHQHPPVIESPQSDMES